ncbi:MAG: sortase [Candidatus Gracilibacteria bacterium]|nr:sortase [Candidatus Gracilibacteria bacterium]
MENNEFENIDQMEFDTFSSTKTNISDLNKEIDNLNNELFYNYDYDGFKEFINKEEKEESAFLKKIRSFSFFGIKYLLTSSLIFVLLLLTTNYQAYINVFNSYIKKDEMQQMSNSIVNSVKASNITNSEKDGDISKEKKDSDVLNNSLKSFINLKDEKPTLDIDITPYDNRVIIPNIGKNIPLIDIKNRTVSGQNELNDIFMKELENGVIRYPGSVKPGEIGNTFIFGHSSNFPWIKGEYNDVFSLLDNVGINDEVVVYYNQKKFVYKINKKNIISPGNVSIFKGNKTKAQVMIMTCRPIGTTLNRLVLTGELVKE